MYKLPFFRKFNDSDLNSETFKRPNGNGRVSSAMIDKEKYLLQDNNEKKEADEIEVQKSRKRKLLDYIFNKGSFSISLFSKSEANLRKDGNSNLGKKSLRSERENDEFEERKFHSNSKNFIRMCSEMGVNYNKKLKGIGDLNEFVSTASSFSDSNQDKGKEIFTKLNTGKRTFHLFYPSSIESKKQKISLSFLDSTPSVLNTSEKIYSASTGVLQRPVVSPYSSYQSLFDGNSYSKEKCPKNVAVLDSVSNSLSTNRVDNLSNLKYNYLSGDFKRSAVDFSKLNDIVLVPGTNSNNSDFILKKCKPNYKLSGNKFESDPCTFLELNEKVKNGVEGTNESCCPHLSKSLTLPEHDKSSSLGYDTRSKGNNLLPVGCNVDFSAEFKTNDVINRNHPDDNELIKFSKNEIFNHGSSKEVDISLKYDDGRTNASNSDGESKSKTNIDENCWSNRLARSEEKKNLVLVDLYPEKRVKSNHDVFTYASIIGKKKVRTVRNRAIDHQNVIDHDFDILNNIVSNPMISAKYMDLLPTKIIGNHEEDKDVNVGKDDSGDLSKVMQKDNSSDAASSVTTVLNVLDSVVLHTSTEPSTLTSSLFLFTSSSTSSNVTSATWQSSNNASLSPPIDTSSVLRSSPLSSNVFRSSNSSCPTTMPSSCTSLFSSSSFHQNPTSMSSTSSSLFSSAHLSTLFMPSNNVQSNSSISWSSNNIIPLDHLNSRNKMPCSVVQQMQPKASDLSSLLLSKGFPEFKATITPSAENPFVTSFNASASKSRRGHGHRRR